MDKPIQYYISVDICPSFNRPAISLVLHPKRDCAWKKRRRRSLNSKNVCGLRFASFKSLRVSSNLNRGWWKVCYRQAYKGELKRTRFPECICPYFTESPLTTRPIYENNDESSVLRSETTFLEQCLVDALFGMLRVGPFSPQVLFSGTLLKTSMICEQLCSRRLPLLPLIK